MIVWVNDARTIPFQRRTYLKLFLMGGSLSCLGVYSFLQIIESNGKNRNQARRPSMKFK